MSGLRALDIADGEARLRAPSLDASFKILHRRWDDLLRYEPTS